MSKHQIWKNRNDRLKSMGLEPYSPEELRKVFRGGKMQSKKAKEKIYDKWFEEAGFDELENITGMTLWGLPDKLVTRTLKEIHNWWYKDLSFSDKELYYTRHNRGTIVIRKTPGRMHA